MSQSLPRTYMGSELLAVQSTPHHRRENSKGSHTGRQKTAEDHPFDPSPDPYVRRPVLAYMHYLLPLFLVVVFSFVFALYIQVKGEVPVPRWLSNFTTSNPRLTAQIVTIFSSFLTAATRWALSGSAALLARKRILNRSRPILEIEMFSSLKNISLVRDWGRQKGMMLFTGLLVALCGLLTSGFVTLLNPLPVPIITELVGGKELNLASTSDSCTDWYSRITGRLRGETCHGSWYYQGFGYSSCPASEVDILDVVKASLLHRTSQDHSSKYSRLVSIFPDLNNTRILGSTAGTLITGPDGIQVFDFPNLSPTLEDHNYTLKLQGLWADVKCSYDRTSPLNVVWGPVHNDSNIEYNISCPGSSSYETGNTTLSDSFVNFEAARICPMENGEKAILFRYFSNTNSSWGIESDYLSCRFPAKVGDVDTALDADLRAFVPVKKPSPTAMDAGLAGMAADEVVRMVLYHFNKRETRAKLWSDRFLYQNRRNNLYDPSVISSVMQEMFEYEATRLRLMLTAMSVTDETFTIPGECFRDVKAVVLEKAVGWNIQPSTVIGLVPLFVVTSITLLMSLLAVLATGRLTLFDPTSPVSLIAATSFGNVVFPKGSGDTVSVGNPRDETVLLTKVSYGQHEAGWGLKSV